MDELVAIIVDAKTVWQGRLVRTAPGVTNPQPVSVPGYGTVVFYWGTEDQALNLALTPGMAGHPPYRRQCFVVLKDFLFGRERTSAPNVEFVVRRKPAPTIFFGSPAQLDAEFQANPLGFLAEVLTDPVFGLGIPADVLEPTSWQGTAAALTADASHLHVSPVLDKGESGRSVVAATLATFDGWLRWDDSGRIEVGRFLHNQAPPVFTPSTTLDFHDLIEEIQWGADGWTETVSEVVVRFRDRDTAYKWRAARAVSGYNRDVVGEPRAKMIEAPWVTRAQQASDLAAEIARIEAEPSLEGTLTVRAAKAANIRPGDLFQLNHDAMQLSLVCRCTRLNVPGPDTDRVQLSFVRERGLAPLPFQPTPQGLGGPEIVAQERIDLHRVVQVPPGLAGGSDFHIAVLAARTSPVTVALRIHLKKDDGSLFYNLGAQSQWAVAGSLAANYPDTVPTQPEPADDDSETLRVQLDTGTLATDLAKISQTQGADAVNDANLLLWVFAPSGTFEVMAVKSLRIVGGEAFYRFKVRRARFGTTRTTFAVGSQAFVLFRSDVVVYSHQSFPSYAAQGATATFRLQSSNAWGEADVGDTEICPDIPFTFTDPYAPTALWLSVKRLGLEVADFNADFALTDDFTLTVQGSDRNSDLIALSIVARLGAESRTILSATTSMAPTLTRAVTFRPSNVSMGEGDWKLVAVVRDVTGRTREVPMTAGGGSTEVSLRLRNAAGGPATCIQPVASPSGGPLFNLSFNLALTTSTSGAEIEYQVKGLGQPAGLVWQTYTGPIALFGECTAYARARKVGLADSPIMMEDYWRERNDPYGRFYQPP